MKNRFTTLGALFLGLTSWGAVLAQTGSFDIVHRKSGSSVRGIIEQTSQTEIILDGRGSKQMIPVIDVRQIIFTQEPSQLRRIRDLVENGQLENGLETLNKIDMSKLKREVVRTEVEYLRLYCRAHLALATGEDVTGAAAALSNFVKQNRDSYHFYQAMQTLGDLAMALGKYGVATKCYARVQSAPWPEYKLLGLLRESKAYLAESKFTEAGRNYEKALAIQDSTATANRLKSMAEIGKARCAAELGASADSIAAVEKIIAANDPSDFELFAQAYNALGATYRRMGKVEYALDAYLHVDLLFHQAKDEHAEALFYLSQLWDKARQPQRSRQSRGLLRSRYPATRWAQR